MAGVFKSLDQSDVRITPFRTHKLWSEEIGFASGSVTGSAFANDAGDVVAINNLRCFAPILNSDEDYLYAVVETQNSGSQLCVFDIADGFNPLYATNDKMHSTHSLVQFTQYTTDAPLIVALTSGSQLKTYSTTLNEIGATDLSSLASDTFYTIQQNTQNNKLIVGTDTSLSNGLISVDIDFASGDVTGEADIADTDPNFHAIGSYKAIVGDPNTDSVFTLMQDGSGEWYLHRYELAGPTRQQTFSDPNPPNLPISIHNSPTTDTVTQIKLNGNSIGLYTLASENNEVLRSFVDTTSVGSTQVPGKVVAILQPDSYERPGVALQDSTLAWTVQPSRELFVVTGDGLLLWDWSTTALDPLAGTHTLSYAQGVDLRQYLNGGHIVAATTNTDVRHLHKTDADIVFSFFVTGDKNSKTPSAVFSYNLTQNTFSDPIHLSHTTWLADTINEKHMLAEHFTMGDRLNTVIAASGYPTTDLETGFKTIKLYKINL